MDRLRMLLLLTPAAGGVTFLIRDDFTTNIAAGSVDGTAAEPGPGTRAVTDTGNNLRINGGRWDQTDGTTTYGDPGTWYDALARVVGRTMMVDQHGSTAAQNWGWDNNQAGSSSQGFQISATVSVTDNGGIGLSDTYADGSRYAIVMRSAGAFYLVKPAAGNWELRCIATFYSPDPVYPQIAGRNTAGLEFDNLRVFDMAAPWDTDMGIATQELSGSRSAGDTFTHEANGFVLFTVDTLPAAGQIELRFRVQDASNYWQVTVDSAGNSDLDEIVAGAPTQRATAGGINNGDKVLIRFNGQQIKGIDTTTRAVLWSYATAANFQTETDGELETEGAGGAVSDIVTFPYTLSGAPLAELEQFEPA